MATKKKTAKTVDKGAIADDRQELLERIKFLENENYALRRSVAKANIVKRELARELKAATAAPKK